VLAGSAARSEPLKASGRATGCHPVGLENSAPYSELGFTAPMPPLNVFKSLSQFSGLLQPDLDDSGLAGIKLQLAVGGRLKVPPLMGPCDPHVTAV
jgi:hypothetical protein